MDDKVKYWLELSDYDLETAIAMLNSRRYLYVGLLCHQTIEKNIQSILYFPYIRNSAIFVQFILFGKKR